MQDASVKPRERSPRIPNWLSWCSLMAVCGSVASISFSWWRRTDWGLYLTKAGRTASAGDLPLWVQVPVSLFVGLTGTAVLSLLIIAALVFIRRAAASRLRDGQAR
jgi:hypothetical protein